MQSSFCPCAGAFNRTCCPATTAPLLQQHTATPGHAIRHLPAAHWLHQRLLLLRIHLRESAVTGTVATAAHRQRTGPAALQTAVSTDFRDCFDELASWKATFGTCHVPSTAADAAELCSWVSAVRKAARKGLLSSEQKQQLDEIGFVWKPDTVEALWHAQYHKLRCWLDSGNGTLQELLQQLRSHDEHFKLQQQLEQLIPNDMQQQQQHSTAAAAGVTQQQHEMHETAVWLARQIELYGKLKLTPGKVTMLRRLGVKLQRQQGLSKPVMHPVLQGTNSKAYVRRPIVVNAVTQQGKRAVGRLLLMHQQQQQEQGQQVGAKTSTAASDSSGSGQSNTYNSVSNEPDVSFMLMLAQLQRWKKRYGNCYVPTGVFDKQELADWVQHVRMLHTAAAAASSSSSSSGSDGSRSVQSAGSSSSPSPSLLQQQQQQCHSQDDLVTDKQHSSSSKKHSRDMSQCDGSASATSNTLQLQHLEAWHVRELNAAGFLWQPAQDDEAWHARYHQLRQFKQTYHHLNVPVVAATQRAGALKRRLNDGGTCSGSSSSGAERQWDGLAEWLEQQRKQLAARNSVGFEIAADGVVNRPLSNLRVKLLRSLGVTGNLAQPMQLDS